MYKVKSQKFVIKKKILCLLTHYCKNNDSLQLVHNVVNN